MRPGRRSPAAGPGGGARRRGPALLLASALALALLPAHAMADDGPTDARPDTAASAGKQRLLVTVERREDVAEVLATLRARWPVDVLAPRVLALHGQRDEVAARLSAHEATIGANPTLAASRAPDDPLFERQWGLHNRTHGVDVRALRAWGHTRGRRDVTIAVVDTRVAEHVDLRGNLRRGRSFAPEASGCRPVAHGTEVAGVAAATADNGEGIAGMAPRARLLSVPFLDDCGNGTVEGAVRAISYAVDEGAQVILASFASDGRLPDRDVASLRAAIEDAGVPVIAAAGNQGWDLSEGGTPRVYPASFDLRNLLTVASVDRVGALGPGSNHGRRHVELAAPGVGVITTTLDPSTGADRYAERSGTSFAAPHVAGAAALGIGLRPVLTPDVVLDLVVDTSRPLPGLHGKVASGGILDAGALVHAIAREGGCPTERVPASRFADVSASSVHRLGVDCIAWWEITRGRSERAYDPRRPVTRGQMATFLATVVDAGPGLPSDPPGTFPDTGGNVHEGAIDALAAVGIVGGHPDGTYRPSQPVTRAQMATFLVNTYEYLVGSSPTPRSPWFQDTGGVHAAAADRLWELGVTAGTAPRTYGPRSDVRRDQMASFVARLLDLVVREGVVPGR